MATKSILKNINIRGKRRVHDFIRALEHAEQQAEKGAPRQCPVVELRTGQIKSLLENYAR